MKALQTAILGIMCFLLYNVATSLHKIVSIMITAQQGLN